MALDISVIVLTYNEEDTIKECLESVFPWAKEIIVVDSGSSDQTLSIVRRFTDKIFVHPFENFAQQRNWAQDNLAIANEWVFHLDADERVSRELALELADIFLGKLEADGFMMPRKTIFREKFIRFGGHYPVYQLRLFKKSKGRSELRMYDQNYIVEGKVMMLKGAIINVIEPDLRIWRKKHRRWAELEAKEVILNKGRILNIGLLGNPIERRNWLRYKLYYEMPIFVRVFFYFFYRLFLKFGFLDGWRGLVFHFWQGLWYRLQVDLKILKLNILYHNQGI